MFKEVFGYDTPGKMPQTLHSLKRVDSFNQETFLIEDMVLNFGDRFKKDARRCRQKRRKENTEDC